MLVGTIATTYSGWFIAPSLAIILSKKTTGVQGRQVAPEAGVSDAPPARKSKTRKARA
jgi:hypothetical protein